MDKILNFRVLAVANGYLLDVNPYRPGETISVKDEYVFETFESLVKFLDANLQKPVVFKNNG